MQEDIEALLNEKICPQLHTHGGNVEIIRVENHTLYLRLLGPCADCPSAVLTVEHGVRTEVLTHFPEIQEVTVEQAVSQDLLEQAREILFGNGRNR